MSRNITVAGIGTLSLKPDLIIISMNVEAADPDYGKTMSAAAESIESVRNAIVSAGFSKDELKTANFNVQTEYESYQDEDRNWKNRFKSYRCIHSLKFEFDFDMEKLNLVLTAISACRADPDFNISFTVRDKAAVSEKLLNAAVKNAFEKAEIIAKAADVKLGNIKNIDYSWNEPHAVSETRMAKTMLASNASMDMAIDIVPENIKASDSVTVVWSIE